MESSAEASDATDSDIFKNIKLGSQFAFYKTKLAEKTFLLIFGIACTVLMLALIKGTFEEYSEHNPITVIKFIDQPEKPDPILVKICNKIFLDEEKVANYNGTDFDEEPVEFLKRSVSGEILPSDRRFIQASPIFDSFHLSPKILSAFKLDLDKFLMTCFIAGSNADCSGNWTFYIDLDVSCFQKTVRLAGYGDHWSLMLGFYFDPNVKFGPYSGSPGALVSIQHQEEYLAPFESQVIAPNDYVIGSATTEHRKYDSFAEGKMCVNEEGTQWKNFTGEPFEMLYSPFICKELCFAETDYGICECSTVTGWNVTKTDCISDISKLSCAINESIITKERATLSKNCQSRCLPKCKQKILRTSYLRQRSKHSPLRMKLLVNDAVEFLKLSSPLLLNITSYMNSSETSIEDMERMLPNFAHVTFYLRNEQQQLMLRVMPFMTLPTFLSNVGGLMGMWLGLSAISIFEFVEALLGKFICGAKHGTEKPVTSMDN